MDGEGIILLSQNPLRSDIMPSIPAASLPNHSRAIVSLPLANLFSLLSPVQLSLIYFDYLWTEV